MDYGKIKTFVYVGDKTYRRTLQPSEYSVDDGLITLPKDHYSKGYIERIIDGIIWEEYPVFKSSGGNPQAPISE